MDSSTLGLTLACAVPCAVLSVVLFGASSGRSKRDKKRGIGTDGVMAWLFGAAAVLIPCLVYIVMAGRV